MTKMPIDVLESFRTLVKNNNNLQEEYFKTPTGVKDLFNTFLEMDPTKEDLMNLLVLLSITDNCDWDQIAHFFL